ncbi:hypothetical protein ACIQXD_35060 [Streptomyces uncialis]|uniref:hypothetical protein n=1 Tax=Streptomyces uncialis TaxID=1048205 RepID=UPI0038230AF7
MRLDVRAVSHLSMLARPFPGHGPDPGDLDALLAVRPEEDDFDEIEDFDDATETCDERWAALVFAPEHTAGAIVISHLGRARREWLVISGPHRGTVWSDWREDGGGLVPLTDQDGEPVTFTRWAPTGCETLSTPPTSRPRVPDPGLTCGDTTTAEPGRAREQDDRTAQSRSGPACCPARPAHCRAVFPPTDAFGANFTVTARINQSKGCIQGSTAASKWSPQRHLPLGPDGPPPGTPSSAASRSVLTAFGSTDTTVRTRRSGPRPPWAPPLPGGPAGSRWSVTTAVSRG